MPTDGAGVYTLPSGYLATLGQVIQPSQHNPPLEDVATGLTNRLTRNGSGSMTADLNFGGNRGTNIAAASAGTDAVQLNQADARYLALSAAETTIASASTVDLATATNYRVAVTGTTTITSFGAGLNQNRQVRFVASLTITHNATALICPNAASIITAAGDVAICQSDGSGNWRIVQYFRAAVDGVSVTWTDIASAATMDVGAVASENLRVTGTTTVTSLGTAASGVTRTLRAAAGFQLTHSANIVCPSAANLVLLADDYVRVSSLGGGVWHVTDARVLATTTAPGLMSAADKVKVNGSPTYVSVAAVATTSGTAFDFTGIPSDAVRISLHFSSVSLSGTDSFLVQLGDSGGFETSGYSGAGTNTTGSGGATVANSSGFVIRSTIAADIFSGTMTFEKVLFTNRWIASHSLGGSTVSAMGGGAKDLSDTLTQVRLTRTGSDTFDNGTVSITYLRAS
jgi:hypothetical protein